MESQDFINKIKKESSKDWLEKVYRKECKNVSIDYFSIPAMSAKYGHWINRSLKESEITKSELLDIVIKILREEINTQLSFDFSD